MQPIAGQPIARSVYTMQPVGQPTVQTAIIKLVITVIVIFSKWLIASASKTTESVSVCACTMSVMYREVKRSVSNGEILRDLTTYLCCADPPVVNRRLLTFAETAGSENYSLSLRS